MLPQCYSRWARFDRSTTKRSADERLHLSQGVNNKAATLCSFLSVCLVYSFLWNMFPAPVAQVCLFGALCGSDALGTRNRTRKAARPRPLSHPSKDPPNKVLALLTTLAVVLFYHLIPSVDLLLHTSARPLSTLSHSGIISKAPAKHLSDVWLLGRSPGRWSCWRNGLNVRHTSRMCCAELVTSTAVLRLPMCYPQVELILASTACRQPPAFSR